jgi:hypothetical protein
MEATAAVAGSAAAKAGLSEPPAMLHFAYRAPFNRSTNALFKVERANDQYAVTQFEPGDDDSWPLVCRVVSLQMKY